MERCPTAGPEAVLGDNCLRLIGDTEPLLNGLEFDGGARRLAVVFHDENGLGEKCCCKFVSEFVGLNDGDKSDQNVPQVDAGVALTGGFRYDLSMKRRSSSVEPKLPKSLNDPFDDQTSLNMLLPNSNAEFSKLLETLELEFVPVEPLSGLDDSRPFPLGVTPTSPTTIDCCFSPVVSISPAELGGVEEVEFSLL